MITRAHTARGIATVLLAFLFTACVHKEAEVSIVRVDHLVFDTDPSALRDSLVKNWQTYETPLLNIDPANTASMAMLADFAADSSMRLIYSITDSLYHNLGWLEHELGRALYNAPWLNYTHFYALVTGDFYDYERRVFCSDNELAISLDHYAIGALHAGQPAYIERLSTKQHIAADCMAAIARAHIALPEGGMTMLDYAIAEGKVVYFIEKTMPWVDDTIGLRYTAQQLRWIRHNTQQVWAYLLQNRLLYSTDLWQYHNLIDEAPKTNVFGEGSAPRTPIYIGWQIVRAYAKRTHCTMQQLFAETDSRQILTQSNWRP